MTLTIEPRQGPLCNHTPAASTLNFSELTPKLRVRTHFSSNDHMHHVVIASKTCQDLHE